MGLYNFQRRFVPKILAGENTHTIRGVRANPDKPGNILHLYTGLRRKGATLLMRVPCGTSRSLQGAGILLYDGVLSMTNFSTTSGTPPTTPEDWAALVHLVNRTIQQLQRKPVELRGGYYLEPGSILNAYREGDLTFDAAKKALETWRERGVR